MNNSFLQFSTLIFVEFVALMVVASPLVQVQAQVTTELYMPLSLLSVIHQSILFLIIMSKFCVKKSIIIEYIK